MLGAPSHFLMGAPEWVPQTKGSETEVGGGVSNVCDRPLVYEVRGNLQIQIPGGADDNPRRRMNTERYK